MKYSAVVVSSLVALVSARDIPVVVGKDGDTFSPDTISAKKGDRLVFTFESDNAPHDVAVSAFEKPCQPATDGQTFYSGMVQPGSTDNVYTVDIESDDTLWVYCSVSGHCQNGMSAVVNAPANGDTLAKYREASAEVKSSKSPSSTSGGTLASSAPEDDSSSGSDDSSSGSDDSSSGSDDSSSAGSDDSSASASATGTAESGDSPSQTGSAAMGTQTGSGTGTTTGSAADASNTSGAGIVGVSLLAVFGAFVAALL